MSAFSAALSENSGIQSQRAHIPAPEGIRGVALARGLSVAAAAISWHFDESRFPALKEGFSYPKAGAVPMVSARSRGV